MRGTSFSPQQCVQSLCLGVPSDDVEYFAQVTQLQVASGSVSKLTDEVAELRASMRCG